MGITVPSREEITRGFDTLNKSRLHGVQGAAKFTSGKPGPRLYLGVCTHGNERVGAGLVVPLLKRKTDGGIELIQGEVVVVINNLLAALQDKRLVDGDFNMNRMPLDVLDGKRWTSEKPSVQRIRELHTAGLLYATHGFDAHTLVGKGDPFKIHIKGDTRYAASIGMPVYVTDIVKHQEVNGEPTVAAGNYIGGVDNDDVPVVEVEGGGPHSDPQIIRGLLNGLVATLGRLQMIRKDLYEREEGEQREYRITDYHVAPEGYEMYRHFDHFERVRENAILAIDRQDPPRDAFFSPRDGHIVMPPVAGEVFGPQGDDWWISEPVKVTREQFLKARGL